MKKPVKQIVVHVAVGNDVDVERLVEQVHLAAAKAGPGNLVEIVVTLPPGAEPKKAPAKKAPAKKASTRR